MRNSITCILVLLLFGCATQTPESIFDEESGQHEVLTYESIDSVYKSFDSIIFDDLDTSYINYSLSLQHKNILKGRSYLIIRNNDIYKFLVGKYRVRDFLPRDKYYYNASEKTVQYLLLDRKLLYSLLDLMNVLEKKGFDKYGFVIRDGFRHPAANAGGAINSQHIFGKAVDIIVRDVNKDGVINVNDKNIILNILDSSVIGSTGGIGRYPGTDVIHIDIRGFRARWDEQ